MTLESKHPGQWAVHLTGGPSRHCQWSYFTQNPQGGGFGSNGGAGASQRSVLATAVRNIPAGASYHLYVNEQYRGLQPTGGGQP